jgi:acyl carrier protein
MESQVNKINQIVKAELADFLGVDLEDIEDESSLEIDLHMKASDLADFMDILKRMDMDISSVNLTEIETFSDLIDALTTRV